MVFYLLYTTSYIASYTVDIPYWQQIDNVKEDGLPYYIYAIKIYTYVVVSISSFS